MSKKMTSVPKPPMGSFPPLLRLLDAYFSSSDPLIQKKRCLDMLLLYCQNIFMNQEQPKYRSIRSRNPRFNADVLSCAGADLVLLEMGFQRRVRDFEEYFILPDSVDISTDYWRVKKYKEMMDKALLDDKNAPANKLKAEREAKEAAIRQIEEDKVTRQERQKRGTISINALSSDSLGSASNASALTMAREAAILRQRALAAPVSVRENLLPTPSLTHLREEDYALIYEPAEDSFALLDALQNDYGLLQTISHQPLVLEVGSGTGIISAFIQQSIFSASVHLCTDINEHACHATLKTSRENAPRSDTFLDDVRTSLTSGLRLAEVDLIVFNPPYVPTSISEIDTTGSIAAAWAGGEDGMDITTQFIAQVSELLSKEGLFYLVTVARNRPNLILQYARTVGLDGRMVLERRAGREKLTILRFHKTVDQDEPVEPFADTLPIQTEVRRMDGCDPNIIEDSSQVGVLD